MLSSQVLFRYTLLLSDNAQERVDYLEARYGFKREFKDGVFSHLAGMRKPDIKIYELALAKTLRLPAECIYIDDKAELLEPAKQLGMHMIWFENPSQLKLDLEELGVNI